MAICLVMTGCGNVSANPETEVNATPASITLFAAASATDAMNEVIAAYTRQTGTRVIVQYASSSTLARQIEQGAAADVYLSANVKWMDHLESQGLIDADSRQNLLSNRLVWIASAGKQLPAENRDNGPILNSNERLALGDPTHVPAGIYARQALESLGRWEDMKSRIIPANDVRAALRLVELGEVEQGIVYATDAATSPKVRVLWTVPEPLHDAVRYPVATIQSSANAQSAREFITFLNKPIARDIFIKHGFQVAPVQSVTPSSSRPHAVSMEVER